MSFDARLRDNYDRTRDRIQSACARVGRDPCEVTLVAVTKYARPEWIASLIDLGCRDLGESRPQQLEQRAHSFGPGIRWHLIGHLQRNKVRRVLPLAAVIHSVDTLPLLERIDLLAAELQLRPRILLEVNISGEEAKNGFAPDALCAAWERIAHCRHVDVAGLMTMAPLSENPETSRPIFRALRDLRNRLAASAPPHIKLTELSMGMSQDFDVAVEEGATFVRVGSDLFTGLEPN